MKRFIKTVNFLTIIISLAVITPFMTALSGCGNGSSSSNPSSKEDSIAPFDITVEDSEGWRTNYFPLSDTGRSVVVREGDDASYVDIPAGHSFTERNISNGTDTDDVVDDNITGLTWLKCTVIGRNLADTNDICSGANVKLSWSHASETCSNLVYAGYDDWRVPTITELFTLLYFNNWPLVDNITPVFPDNENATNSGYWSSTTRIFM